MEGATHKSKLMRKNKHRHNEKSRQIINVVIDKKEQAKIKIEDSANASLTYDDCNALVLPSKKRKTKKLQKIKAKSLLSKKKKKKLEKIMERKLKKVNRANLLEELGKVQAKPMELQCLTSLQTNQTLGRKLCLQQNFEEIVTKDLDEKPKENIFKRLNKRCQNEENRPCKRRRYFDTPHIVETSSSSENEDEIELKSEIKANINTINNTDLGINQEIETQAACDIVEQDTNDVEVIETKISKDIVEIVTKPNILKNIVSTNVAPAVFKVLNRLQEINEYRMKLPVVSMEYEIMTAINENNIVIIDGSTGSGKTTQVPQFLFEAGFTNNGKMIAVTEPRRVAAIEMSKRVAYEMNLGQDEISYQIRFEGNVSANTKVKYLTDGVLLKEFLDDPLLEKYSAIIIDEAHERSVFTDIMIGILSRVVRARQKMTNILKVIIMSATMDESSFTDNRKLFAKMPPVVKVDSRMFEVVVHYNKVTHVDYIDQAYRKACKVHRQLPPGGILIFVTGKEEVLALCRKLRQTFPALETNDPNKGCAYEEKMQANKERRKQGSLDMPVESLGPKMPQIKLSDFSEENLAKLKETEVAKENFGIVDDEDDDLVTTEEKMRLSFGDIERESEQPLHILPMFSLLNSEKLNMVFKNPPLGTRLCVVATNIAETSLTIPNIVYVIDSGKIKGKAYNPTTGISRMQIMWTSKASADQRKGRAGRVQNGHCYRLYSATAFTDLFANHAPADILRRPVDDVVLAMKTRKIPVITFPYITPPPVEELQWSIKRLKMLGALCEPEAKQGKELSKITPFGKKMCKLPLAPRFSKMILESFVYPELLPYFILLVCGLTVQEVILEISKKDEGFRVKWLGNGMSRYLGDLMILISGILKAEESPNSKKFCEDNGIRYKAYLEIRKLRRQVTNETNLIFPILNVPLFPKIDQLSNAQANMMRKIILQGSLDRIAKKVRDHEIKDDSMKKKFSNAYRIISSEEPIYLHFTSPFRNEFPSWVVYQDIYEVNGKKIMRGVSTIEAKWVSELAPDMCIFSDPLSTPVARYDSEKDCVMCHRNATFGPHHWIIPKAEYRYPYIPKVYDIFLYHFLNGDVCPMLKRFSDKLYDINSLTCPFSVRFSTIRTAFIKALLQREAVSFEALQQTWQINPTYLLAEYLAWLKDGEFREEVENMWPPYEKHQEAWMKE